MAGVLGGFGARDPFQVRKSRLDHGAELRQQMEADRFPRPPFRAPIEELGLARLGHCPADLSLIYGGARVVLGLDMIRMSLVDGYRRMKLSLAGRFSGQEPQKSRGRGQAAALNLPTEGASPQRSLRVAAAAAIGV